MKEQILVNVKNHENFYILVFSKIRILEIGSKIYIYLHEYTRYKKRFLFP